MWISAQFHKVCTWTENKYMVLNLIVAQMGTKKYKCDQIEQNNDFLINIII